jgi:hypothetical protein
MEQTEFDNSNLISYCGLVCSDCPLFNGNVSDLAKNLRKELRRVQYDKFAEYMSKFPSGKELKDFETFYSVLGTLIKYRCEGGCKKGGGSKDCEIRQCNLEQNLKGCWECSKFKFCSKLNALNSLHGDKHRKNLEIICKKGPTELLKDEDRW